MLPAGVTAQFNQLRVTATPGYGNGSDVTVVPDSNLKFNFTNLVAGTNYRIKITDHQNHFPDSWWKSNSSTMGFWTNSSEIKAGSTSAITLRPAKSASISGSIVVPSADLTGDINGDGRSDILSIDRSGRLFTHLGKGNGFFAKSYQSGQGWL